MNLYFKGSILDPTKPNDRDMLISESDGVNIIRVYTDNPEVNNAYITFRRSDGAKLGPFIMIKVLDETVNAYEIALTKSLGVLAIPGELQFTIQLVTVVLGEDEETVISRKVQATGKQTCHVYEGIGLPDEISVVEGQILQLQEYIEQVPERIRSHDENPTAHGNIKSIVDNHMNDTTNPHEVKYAQLHDKPLDIILDVGSLSELTSGEKEAIYTKIIGLLNESKTELNASKYSDIILRYNGEEYYPYNSAIVNSTDVIITFTYTGNKTYSVVITLTIPKANASGTAINPVYEPYDPSGSINAHNTSETAHTDIRNAVAEAKAIAEGKSRARVFATKNALDTWLLDSENIALLQIGDNFYIEETDKPDYWWNGTTIKELETQKVDLTEYAKSDDLATVATTGSYNDLTNKPTIPTVPTISTNITTDATSDAKTASPKAVKTYVDNAISSLLGGEY